MSRQTTRLADRVGARRILLLAIARLVPEHTAIGTYELRICRRWP